MTISWDSYDADEAGSASGESIGVGLALPNKYTRKT